MKVYSIFDPHCFVWDLDDFNNNKSKYYTLLDELIEFIVALENEKEISYLLRAEIIWEITNAFPSSLIDESLNRNDIWDKLTIVYSFLSRKLDNTVEYSNDLKYLQTTPNFVKEHFNDNLKVEVKILLTEMLSSDDDTCIIFTIEKLWGNNTALHVSDGSQKERVFNVYKTSNEIAECFTTSKMVFKPSPKHNDPDGWGTILPKELELECYSLIDTAIAIEDSKSQALYAYSDAHRAHVIFRVTLGREYHAYPVKPEEVPSKIKKYYQTM